jgi:hypothetical protein
MVSSTLQNVKASIILLLLILCLFDGVLINHDHVEYFCVNCTEFTTTGVQHNALFSWFHVSKTNVVLTRHREQYQFVDMMYKYVKYEYVNACSNKQVYTR